MNLTSLTKRVSLLGASTLVSLCFGLTSLLTACGSSTSDSDSTRSRGCTADCIEADVEMADGAKQHMRWTAFAAALPSLHRMGVWSVSINNDGEMGISIEIDSTKVAPVENAQIAVSGDGASLHVQDDDDDFVGVGGQVVFTGMSETPGGGVDGTFDAIVAKDSTTGEVIKVTNGVFHTTIH